MAPDETVIDDGEFHMEELITFHRQHSDHDYQLVKAARLPGGYVDLPLDEDWPPALKKRMKSLHFDYGDGKDYIPPIIKEESYEHSNTATKIEDVQMDTDFLASTLLSTGRKLGQVLHMYPLLPPLAPTPVKNEDILVEEVHDYDPRNITEVKSFVVNGPSDL